MAESLVRSRNLAFLCLAFLCLFIMVVYYPALRGDVLWDDSGHITSPELQSWNGLAQIWFDPTATQQYYPLLHTAFWIEHKLWGDAVLGYHLVNILAHAGSCTGLFNS